MNLKPGNLRTLTVTAMTLAVVGGAVLFARPRSVSNEVLGAGWSCKETAFVLTTCAPTAHEPEPATDTSSKEAVARPPRV